MLLQSIAEFLIANVYSMKIEKENKRQKVDVFV